MRLYINTDMYGFVVNKVNDKLIDVMYPHGIKKTELFTELLILITGTTRDSGVITNNNKVIGIRCSPADWYDFIKNIASQKYIDEFVYIVKDFGFNTDFLNEESVVVK